MLAIHIGRRAVNEAIKVVVERFEELTIQLAQRVINADAWERKIAFHLKRLYSVAAVAGHGGKSLLSPDAQKVLNVFTAEQLAYLHDFAIGLAKGEISINNRVLARLRMYANAARNLFETIARMYRCEKGYQWERRVLGRADMNCRDCKDLAAKGWQPIGTLPPPGKDTSCLTACRCRLQFAKKKIPA